ncbi:MAG: endonuclease/exonuclease/phosphatase family protein [Desulfovibrionales bacterium]
MKKRSRIGKTQIKAATYNVHQWVGTDRRYDPGRGLRVLQDLNADLLGLQEVNFPRRLKHRVTEEHLSSILQMRLIQGRTMYRKEASYGNLLLSRFPPVSIQRHDITLPPYEPRGIIDALFEIKGSLVRVLVTHLGLRMRERWYQHQKLKRIISSGKQDIVVLMGDFNEWIPLRFLFRTIHAMFEHVHAPRTFPTFLPALALDRIMVNPKDTLTSIRVHKTALSRTASDHFPVTATFVLPE